MAFINTSVVNAANVVSSAKYLSNIQSGTLTGIDTISTNTSAAVSSIVAGGSRAISTPVASVSNYLQTALKSISSTFDSGVKSLASSIDSNLKNIFGNTDVKTVSTVTSQISDPIKTNLLSSSNPLSTAFKVSSLEAGSQSVTLNGTTSTTGTTAESMIGTNLTTVMNRLNLDSTSGILTNITNSKTDLSLRGLFSSVNTLASTVQTAATTLVSSASKSLSNELQVFLGRTAGLSEIAGIDATSYFLPSTDNTLISSTGDVIDTNGSGVDSSTANSILDLARLIGCSESDGSFYNSLTEVSSLYNYILALASSFSIKTIVENLLGCTQASSLLGQEAIEGVFKDTVSTGDIDIASLLLENIVNKSSLSDDTVLKSIVTNSSLTSVDIGTVNSILTSLGTDVDTVYGVEGLSTDTVPVYDYDTLSGTDSSLLNVLFDDTAFSTYLNQSNITLSSDGTLVF